MSLKKKTHRTLFLGSWALPKIHQGNHFSKRKRNLLVVLKLFESLRKRLIHNLHTGWNFSYNTLYDLCHYTLSNLPCTTNERDNKEACSPLWGETNLLEYFQDVFYEVSDVLKYSLWH